jgi:hypothetical protein
VDRTTKASLGDRPGEGVRVVVFDTWPMDQRGTLNLIRDFRNALQNRPVGPPVDSDLNRAADGGLVAEDRVFDLVGGPPLSGLRCFHRRNSVTMDSPYPVADHGLFVANIVKDVAPYAELHVYRVSNDWGATDLYTLAAAVRDAIARFESEQKEAKDKGIETSVHALVLNLSLGFAPELLTLQALLDDPTWPLLDPSSWGHHLAAAVPPDDGKGTRRRTIRRLEHEIVRLERSLWVLDHIFGFDLGEGRVFVVAAAGNDSSRTRGRISGPRVPAAIEGVLGVSAAKNRAGDLASYSNDDDFVNTPDDGVSAFGGDADDITGLTTDGIFSLYVSPNIPPDAPNMPNRPGTGSTGGARNTRGWASWSGTSFAAPIAAGFAACLWSVNRNYTAQEIMNFIIQEPGPGRPKQRKCIPLFQSIPTPPAAPA